MTDHVFILAADADPAAAVTGLAAGLETAPGGATPIRRRFLDSFDWRLHRAGLSLVLEDGHWRLRRLADDAVESEAPADAEARPRFAADFPRDGGLRKRLARLLKMRAVIHLVGVRGESRSWRVLNEDRKTVLRVDHAELRAENRPDTPPLHLIALHPLRGYEEPVTAARERAASLGLSAAQGPVLDAVLRAAGLEPEGYSSKFRAELAGDRSAIEAGVVVGRTLLETMRHNEAGVRRDIDTEFLHDFRVAVRRLRSALGIFGQVFDAGTADGFKREFAALGRLTGPLRDLDVYLLDERRCRLLLPPALAPGLDPLFADLRERRRGALAEVRHALEAPAYRELTRRWAAFLDAPTPGPAAATPVLELARHHLARRHGRLVKKGSAIGPRTPAAALHRLRIQGKKLRYLLEFFASLFPEEDVSTLVRHLKDLQDNLGEFNDLSVQQDMLRKALDALPPRRRGSLDEAAALGGLITALAARQREVRREFAATFAAFTRPEVSQRFAALVESEREARS